MTDTGQVPAEGLPESAGMVEQPGVAAHGAYTYLSETTAEDEDLLLLPGAQSPWGNEVAPPAPEPVVETVHEPGPHETAGRDSGSVDLGGVRLPDPAPAAPSVPIPPITPRRPLHLGPPTPDASASPVRSLADRGPAGAPVRHPGPPTAGPEYLDASPQGATPWGAQPQSQATAQVPTGVPTAETVVPAPTSAPDHATAPVGAAQAVMARLATETGAAAQDQAQGAPAEHAAGDGPDTATGVVPGELPTAAGHASGGPADSGVVTYDPTPVGVAADGGQGSDAHATSGAPIAQGQYPAEQLEAPAAPWAPATDGVPQSGPVDAPPPVAAAGGVESFPEADQSPEQGQAPDAAHAPADTATAAVQATEPVTPVDEQVVAVAAATAAQTAPLETQVDEPGAPGTAQVTDSGVVGSVGPESGQVADSDVPASEQVADSGAPADGQVIEPGVPLTGEAVDLGGPETGQPAGVVVSENGEVPEAEQTVGAGAVEAIQAPEATAPDAGQAVPAAGPDAAPPADAGVPAQGPATAVTPEPQPATAFPAAPHAAHSVDGSPVVPEEAASHGPQTVVQAVTDTQGAEGQHGRHVQAGAVTANPAATLPVPEEGVPAAEPAVPVHPVTEAQDGEARLTTAGTVPVPGQAAPAPEPAVPASPQDPAAEPVPGALQSADPVPPADPAVHRPGDAVTPPDSADAPDAVAASAEDQAGPSAEAEPVGGPQSLVVTPAGTGTGSETQPDRSLGQFVAVPGSVPTTPHLAPTPEPVATVPAPREADPDLVQNADDLDTRAADQEESTAAVEEVRESTGPAAPAYEDAEREAVLKVMRERRDIRNGFRSDPIPHEVLLRVLEAAHTAPSVGHSQPWDFVVIRSADTRRSMHELAMRQRDAYAKSLPKGRAKQFKELKIEAILETPVNIVVTADPTRGGRHTLGRHTQPQMAPYSAALAVENLWLAARAEGLGVGWVSFFDEREMVRALGLPEHLEVIAYLCVGYVDEFPDEPELMQAGWSKRRPLSWVVHEETYGRRALPGEEPHDLLSETVAQIRPLDAKALGEAWERQKRMTKPAGALGMLEIISAQLSGLSRQCPPPIPEPAAVAIFAGDHGVHAQGVTPWPQEVTAQMVANFLGGGAVCNAFAGQVGAEVCVVDVGVAADLPATPGLLPRKIRAGTSDMTTGPAMTREEAKQAIEVGIETARDLVAAGNKALLTGEMGIANTTASAALISVFTDTDPAEVTGRGTGINDETLARKTEVVRRAIELHQPDPADPVGVLAAIGGFEHAAMVGLLLGGASLRTPVILDGVSAGAAALVARAIAPEVLAACIAGHRSAEPGHVAALNKLGLRPLVDLDLRLGEGTGALLALPLVQSTARAMHEVATFDSAGVTEK
jgi:nicotinate-nucleotide--dimethylbenzimidazole phosphoribosyltransferase